MAIIGVGKFKTTTSADSFVTSGDTPVRITDHQKRILKMEWENLLNANLNRKKRFL